MLPGRLRDKIDIYAESRSTNDYSERVKSYAFSFSVKAEISFMSGLEKQYQGIIDATRSMKFKVYFKMTKYNERQVIKFRDEYYNIRSIDPDRDRTYLILTADRMPTETFNVV